MKNFLYLNNYHKPISVLVFDIWSEVIAPPLQNSVEDLTEGSFRINKIKDIFIDSIVSLNLPEICEHRGSQVDPTPWFY